jgi:hypothetical protein
LAYKRFAADEHRRRHARLAGESAHFLSLHGLEKRGAVFTGVFGVYGWVRRLKARCSDKSGLKSVSLIPENATLPYNYRCLE